MKLLFLLVSLLIIASSIGIVPTPMLRSSSDDPSEAICSKDDESGLKWNITGSTRTMDNYPIAQIKYCTFHGTFVFYSKQNYQGDIKYQSNKFEGYLHDMEPQDGPNVRLVHSVRLIGKPEQRNADTITFFHERNFLGSTEMYSDENPGDEYLNSPWSAIVTGQGPWTVYDVNEDCTILEPESAAEGIANFFEDVEATVNFSIRKVSKGCHCPGICSE